MAAITNTTYYVEGCTIEDGWVRFAGIYRTQAEAQHSLDNVVTAMQEWRIAKVTTITEHIPAVVQPHPTEARHD